MLARLACVVARHSTFFSLSFLRRLRNLVYSMYLKIEDISIDGIVGIYPAHASSANGVKTGKRLQVSRNVELVRKGGLWWGERIALSEGALILTGEHPSGYLNIGRRLNDTSLAPLRIEDDVCDRICSMISFSVTRKGQGAAIAADVVLVKEIREVNFVNNTTTDFVCPKILPDCLAVERQGAPP